MRLLVDPNPGLIDEPVSWRVEGAGAGSRVTLRLSAADGGGRRWRSEGSYAVGAGGALALADPDEPWTSMRPAAGGVPVVFTAPDTEWPVNAELVADGRTATATVRRLYRRGVEVDERSGDGCRLLAFVPRGRAMPAPAVLVVPGSTGAEAMAPTAALLASHGYAAAVLGYMDGPGLPRAFDRIPLELVQAGLSIFAEADRGHTAVWAASVGTGLTLSALAAPGALAVAAVVAVAPTDVVWQALGRGGPPPRRSSLTHAGADLPWLGMHGQALIGQLLVNALRRRLPGRPRSTALRLHEAYARGRADAAALERATIPVERIGAPMLLLAGSADAMWPAEAMARRIAQRRASAGAGARDELVVLADAGHFARPPASPATVDRTAGLVSGGTPAGNAAGQRRAWDAALAFLRGSIG